MAREKRYIPIAVVSTVIGFGLFLLLALQTGSNFRSAGVSFGDLASSANANELFPGVSGAIQRTDVSPVPISEKPIRIIIPKLNVDATLEHVGVNAKGEVGIPVKFENAAWYDRSTRPGERGNALIDGHLNDRLNRPAVFADLDELTPGDAIIVQYPNGASYIFSVDTNITYAIKDVPMAELLAAADTAQLNLITCTGTWIQRERQYDERRVITSHMVGVLSESGL